MVLGKVTKIIEGKEKAKLATLMELLEKKMDGFELARNIQEKYYSGSFNASPFIKELRTEGLIEDVEGKCSLADEATLSKLLLSKEDEIRAILSLDFGKGDIAGQLYEQEKYILFKVLSLGNSITVSELNESIYADVDDGSGPFAGYSRSSYGKNKARITINGLVERRFLRMNGSLSIPKRTALDLISEDLDQVLLMCKSTSEKAKHLLNQNETLSSSMASLNRELTDANPIVSIEKVAIPQRMKDYIDKANRRIGEGSFSEAILNCYRVSEDLVKILFQLLYPGYEHRRMKHEAKLSKIWNDDQKEKHEYPGIKAIASLFAVILWYRNKMAAHTELEPTKEAARVSLVSLVQAVIEFKRLNIEVAI